MSDGRQGRPMRLCLLGCGRAATLHSRTLRALHRELRLSYASRDPDKALEYKERHGGAGAFASYDEALASPEVDVAAVLTPPASHLEWTLRALRAGKDVVLEKPALLRSADFDLVEAACREAGRRVYVAENYFYKPLAAVLRRLLAEEWVGEPLFLHLSALKRQQTGGWRDDAARAGGGALFEGGIHWVSLAASLGPAVRRVRAARAGAREGLERSMALLLEYEGGAVATLSYSWEAHSPLRGLRLSRIYGREGGAVFESNGLFLALWGRRTRLLVPGLRDLQGYRAMWRDFLRAWRAGEEAAMSLARARRDLEIVEEAYRSAGVGRDTPQGGNEEP